jgi:hypothetical protein
MKKIFVFILTCIGFMSFGLVFDKKPNQVGNPQNDTIVTPKNFIKIAEATGDLDKDNIAEQVIVYNTKTGENGVERAVYIYKNENKKWRLWHQTTGAVLSSKDEIDENNDTFAGLSILNGCIVIDHTGLDGERWTYTHKYRFQNNKWLLIGATQHRYYVCSGWTDFDYNLITGKIIYETVVTICKNGKSKILPKTHQVFTQKISTLDEMDGYRIGENTVDLGKNLSFNY